MTSSSVLDKRAASISVYANPEFRRSTDSTFGVPMEEPQGFVLDTETSAPSAPIPHIGDVYDPGMGVAAPSGDSLSDEVLGIAKPQELIKLKEQAGVPNVFGHGAVSSLIHTYNSVSMIDRYMPDLEEALDRLGRLIFLLYWKPRDFEDAFGTDDMADMENHMISTFQTYGDFILDLLKKNDRRDGEAGGNSAMYAGH